MQYLDAKKAGKFWYVFFYNFSKPGAMLRNVTFAVGSVIAYLVIYLLLLQSERTQVYGFLMLFFFPLVICWMVYTILKHGKYKGRELGKEEFGYQDKTKDQLKMF